MQNTRSRILQYLKTYRQATSADLSRVFDLTQANIRHHLNLLADNGQIEIIGQTEPEQRGRPAQIYMLSRTAEVHALDELASALLRATAAGPQQDRTVKKTAVCLAGRAPEPHKSITIRFGQAVERLNELHYNAHWEARAESPQILLKRCPYSAIIHQHPELCAMDAELIAHLTGERFEQIEKISRRKDGPAQCRFQMKSDG